MLNKYEAMILLIDDKINEIAKNWIYPTDTRALSAIAALISMQLLFGALVYYTGGTQAAYLHIFYVPIVLGGFLFSITGGILSALLAGIILGPLMPVDVMNNTIQPVASWLTRLALFVMMGCVSGLTSKLYKRYLDHLQGTYMFNPITKLLNLVGIREKFYKLAQQEQDLVVIAISMNNLNDIERALGPVSVEALLKQVAKRIKSIAASDVLVAHSQTSGFFLVVPEPIDISGMLEYYWRSLTADYEIDGLPVFAEFCLGATIREKGESDFSSLIRRSIVASQIAASRTQRFVIYDDNVVDKSYENVKLLHDLSIALDKKELELYYQPKVDIRTNKVIGVEALVRWNRHGEPVSAGNFIPLLERTTLIDDFTLWVTDQALHDLEEFQRRGLNISLAINFSVRNFYSYELCESFLYRVSSGKINPSLLEVEVTESAIVADIKEVARVLRNMREEGIKVSIDDFGTGQASHRYLFELPIDGIKVDQLFVRSLAENPAAQAIMRSAVFLGKQLGLSVVAEGVETEAQRDYLLALGCTVAQGYYFAKPMKIDDFYQWLETWQTSHYSEEKLGNVESIIV